MEAIYSVLVRDVESDSQRLVDITAEGIVLSERYVAGLEGFALAPPDFGRHGGSLTGRHPVTDQATEAAPIPLLMGGELIYAITYYNRPGAELPMVGLLGYASLPTGNSPQPDATPIYLAGGAAINYMFLDTRSHHNGAMAVLPPEFSGVRWSEYLRAGDSVITRMGTTPTDDWVEWVSGGIMFEDGHSRLYALSGDESSGELVIQISEPCAPGWNPAAVAHTFTSSVPPHVYQYDPETDTDNMVDVLYRVASAAMEIRQQCAEFGSVQHIPRVPVVIAEEFDGAMEYWFEVYGEAFVSEQEVRVFNGFTQFGPYIDWESDLMEITDAGFSVDGSLEAAQLYLHIRQVPMAPNILAGLPMGARLEVEPPPAAFWTGFQQAHEILE